LSAAESDAVSPLNSLKGALAKRREEIAGEQILELEVPRWENPTLVVSYKPVEHSVIRRTIRSVEKAKGDRSEAEMNANADFLIKACVGVIARDPNERWEGFDDELAESLGVEGERTARRTCRELFITDGDLISHVNKVIEFSGYRNVEIDEEISGE
jgi:hypothetical protein